jgi:hypothetical protein
MATPQPITVTDPQPHAYNVPAAGLIFRVKTPRFLVRAPQGATVTTDGGTIVLPPSTEAATMTTQSGIVTIGPPTDFPVDFGPAPAAPPDEQG